MDKKKKRTIIILSTLAVIVLSGIIFYTSYHKWNEATCETPKTCSICKKTDGEPLGHKWVKATCETPKTCSVCKKTDGEPLGHKWEEATCKTPRTCSVCKKTEGKPLGHEVSKWTTIKESTCSKDGLKEGTCSRCKETVSESLDKVAHTTGDWEVKTNCVISAQAVVTPGEEVQKCKSCGKELNSREYTIELTTSQRNAILKAYERVNSWHCGRDYLINELLVSDDGYPIEDATFAVDHMNVDWKEEAVKYAKENGRGESKNKLTEEMLYYGFNQEQIDKALVAVGY
ncbi:hypothetical protein [Allobaculum stercoricanis]|uniref:hypothetical protein n=1 Tax=Allobaculum stercoricanis TaxID=174709 RepID=UPI00036590AD|nr:hypothetical protein [Allobaculum stercoricanis]